VKKKGLKALGSLIWVLVFVTIIVLYLADEGIDGSEEFGLLGNLLVWGFTAYIWAIEVLPSLWRLAGKEVITLTPGKMKIRRHAFGVGFTRKYPIGSSTNFRIGVRKASFWKSGGLAEMTGGALGRIAFETKAKTQWFGLDIEPNEAENVLGQMQSHGFIPR
jgi:hypothetical protein